MKLSDGLGWATAMLLALIYFSATGHIFSIVALPIHVAGMGLVIAKKYKVGAVVQVVAAGLALLTAVGTIFALPFPILGLISVRNASRYPKLLELHVESGGESIFET